MKMASISFPTGLILSMAFHAAAIVASNRTTNAIASKVDIEVKKNFIIRQGF
jgi:hypothetical protein